MVNFTAEMVKMEYDSIKNIVDAYSKQISEIEEELAGFDERKKQLQKSLKKFKSKFDMWNKMLKASEVPDEDEPAEEPAHVEETTTVEPLATEDEVGVIEESFPVEEVIVNEDNDDNTFPVDDFDWQ